MHLYFFYCIGATCLLGSNDQSLGWDITHNKALYNECVISDYPDDESSDFEAPEVVLVILNMKDGVLKFYEDP